MKRHRRATDLALAFAAALLPACKPAAPAASHVRLTSIDPLRRTFNADSGKVRAIFLASPT